MSLLMFDGGSGGPPTPPSRADLMATPWHFQGLRVPIPTLTGWFEPAISWIPASQRPLVYATKDAAGDRLYGLSLSGSYTEANQPYAQFAGVDYTKNPSALTDLIDEILEGGPNRAIRLFGAGDGQGSGPGYNDPVGMTYGCQWLINYLPTLATILGPRYRFLQLWPGYDGVFYGWTPQQVQAFGAAVRAVWPDIVLGIEFDPGHIPVGNGAGDYAPGGTMDAYDIIAGEFDAAPYLTHNDAVWQVCPRLRAPGQAYTRPPDQPSGDDPNPPAYLADSPRGPRRFEFMEWSTYYDVRGQCAPAGIEADRQYIRSAYPYALVA